MARILVIDDESNIRMMVRMALEHVGHFVDLAIDGEEGLRMYGEGGKHDLVLLDQRMPGMQGIDVLREILQRSPNARIVMITAYGTVDLAVSAMKNGATDFLRKPFTADTLRRSVQAALADHASASQSAGGPLLGITTLNGYRIEYQSGRGVRSGSDTVYPFTVRSPDGEAKECKVTLPALVVELVKAHADAEQLPHGSRFWEALCEAELANFLWQHSELPPDNGIRIEDLTSSLKKWVDSVLASGTAEESNCD